MKKKLITQGPKDRHSYTITIPKEWVKKQKLDETKKVELKIVKDRIIISPCKKRTHKAEISAEEYKESLIKVIPGLYRLGVKEIKIKISESRQLEEIVEIIRKKLIGYEIIEQKKEYVIIKDITKESEEDFNSILRRVFRLIIELSKTRDKTEIKMYDKTIKRLANYSQRIMITKSTEEMRKKPFYYLLIDQLENAGDELTWILEEDFDEKMLKEIMKTFKEMYETFYKYSPKKFDKNCKKAYDIKNKIKLKKKIELSQMHLHNLARIINSISGTIFIIKGMHL